MCFVVSLESILQERDYRQRTHTARYRCYPTALSVNLRMFDIANNTIAILLGCIRNTMDTHIDQHSVGFNHIGSNKFRFTNSNHKNICLPCYLW